MKNKIELRRGCMSFGMDYNDKSISDMDSDEMKVIYNKLVNYLLENRGFTYYHLIEAIVEQHGSYSSDGEICEQCGDIVECFEIII